jgi:His/Glu/Gln/Arg/opine family amino acid ABC transporter permease subunit
LRYIVDFQSLNPYLPTYVKGIGMTILFSTLAICLSFALGLPWVAMRMSSNRVASRVARGYVEFVRNVPLLVWLYCAYFGLASLGLHLSGFAAALLAFTVYGVAYTTEIYRAGILSVPRGQWEAADALGLSRPAIWRRVVLPQALRAAFHPLGNLVIASVLGSSLVVVLSVPDLTTAADDAGVATFRYFEAFVLAAVCYIVAAQLIQAVWRGVGARAFPVYVR